MATRKSASKRTRAPAVKRSATKSKARPSSGTAVRKVVPAVHVAQSDARTVARKLRLPSSTSAIATLDASRRAAESVVEVNRQVWLAALGLIAQTRKSAGRSLRSVKSLDALIKVGETLEENARDSIERSASLAKKRIAASSDAMDSQLRKLEELVDDRVAAALDRMGLPTVRVLDQLIKKVEALQAQVISKTTLGD